MMTTLIVAASALNLRQEPRLDSAILASMERGETVEALDSAPDGYWLRVRYHEQEGWASAKYLQPVYQDALLGAFPWFDFALLEYQQNIAEVAGPGAHPRIVQYLRSTSLNAAMAASDETPWCSAFVNFCVEQTGYAGTDSAMARSWLHWGKPTDRPVPGCIVVFSRGEPPSGHVAFYVGQTADQIRVLGGNQGNRISFSDYPKERLLGFRVPR
jgi:uncharacterized protein (TIGR02594 family)